MTTRSALKRTVRALAAMALFVLSTAFAAGVFGVDSADAQSSVRPPAGAVINDPQTGGTVPGGSQGNLSDSEMWRSVRKGIEGNVSIPDKNAGVLVQSEGDNWRALRNGPIKEWGAIALGAIFGILVLFYLLRGKIMIEHGPAGKTVTRFADIERIGHWLLAVSFIILAITGLNITYGKYVLLPVIGPEAFSWITTVGKWLHNYVAFAFMVGVVMTFVTWIKHNFPNKHDLNWIAKGGGLFVKGVHPPSKKFNAGQKLIFWSVFLGGVALSLTGIVMLFPFQIDFSPGLSPMEEMQFVTIWHTIISIGLIVIVVGHIYIGSIGMEGAFDAMGSGEVDQNWAREHHSIWADEVLGPEKAAKAPKKKAKGSKGGGEAAPAPAE